MINARLLVSGLIAIGLAACGGEQQPAGPAEPGDAPEAPGPSVAVPGATVFIITPTSGSTVSSPVTVKFGISGIELSPAGKIVPNSGHHHLLIDTELANPGLPIPSDEQHLHFGKGQTETTLELPPGDHTLQLVLGDGLHKPHQPPVMSDRITITVK